MRQSQGQSQSEVVAIGQASRAWDATLLGRVFRRAAVGATAGALEFTPEHRPLVAD